MKRLKPSREQNNTFSRPSDSFDDLKNRKLAVFHLMLFDLRAKADLMLSLNKTILSSLLCHFTRKTITT